jgi:hypothetical protein
VQTVVKEKKISLSKKNALLTGIFLIGNHMVTKISTGCCFEFIATEQLFEVFSNCFWISY